MKRKDLAVGATYAVNPNPEWAGPAHRRTRPVRVVDLGPFIHGYGRHVERIDGETVTGHYARVPGGLGARYVAVRYADGDPGDHTSVQFVAAQHIRCTWADWEPIAAEQRAKEDQRREVVAALQRTEQEAAERMTTLLRGMGVEVSSFDFAASPFGPTVRLAEHQLQQIADRIAVLKADAVHYLRQANN